MNDRITQIKERLQSLVPIELEITDKSHRHRGHPGARDGRGHFYVRIVSQNFENKSKLNRHRQVYQALGDLMQNEIHALAISALAPSEAGAAQEEGS
ncbi:MAG: BolA family transcriptional regulator [Gammaproteobacteria bacterium]|nr:BolA family transcriptional regulator [Gammaproteobacteria bacterium]MDH3768693.1 BolA family transcriptional regulator [Gammaproteobacteria bacterium]